MGEKRFFGFCGLVVLLCSINLITGCQTLDGLTGVNPDGTISNQNPASAAGGLLGQFIPWAGAALMGVTGLYQNIRRRKYAKALHGIISSVDAVRSLRNDRGEIKLQDEKLVEILKGFAEQQSSRNLIDKEIAKLKGKQK